MLCVHCGLSRGSASRSEGCWNETCVRCRTGMWEGDKIILKRMTYILSGQGTLSLVPVTIIRRLGACGPREIAVIWRG